MKILGISLERETSIVAFVALLISISSLLSSLYHFFRASDVEFVQPKLVVLMGTDNGFLHVSSILTYVNTGSPGYHDVLKDESLEIDLQKIKLKYRWKDYINSSVDMKGTFVSNRVSEASAVQIESGNAVSHETLFVPRTEENIDTHLKNWIRFKDFLAISDTLGSVVLKFNSTTYNGEVLTKDCKVLTNHFLESLKENNYSTTYCY